MSVHWELVILKDFCLEGVVIVGEFDSPKISWNGEEEFRYNISRPILTIFILRISEPNLPYLKLLLLAK